MAAIPGSILVAPSTAGKLLDTVTVVTTEGTVHREAVFIGDPANPANRASVTTAGELLVAATVIVTSGNFGLTSDGSTKLVGQVTVSNPTTAVTVSNPTTAVDATLTSAGSTRLVGQVTVANPTTAVSVANPTTAVTITNPTTALDATLTSAGSTRLVGRVEINTPTTAVNVANPTTAVTITNPTTAVTVSNPSTSVDATLTSAGSTRLVGQVTIANPTTAVTVSNPTTAVDLSSNGSTRVVGLVGPSSQWTITVGNPTTSVTYTNAATTAVTLAAGSSATVIGQAAISTGNPIYLGQGTSATYQFMQSIPFSSGNTARTSVSTTVDISVIAANANRKGLLIANLSTVQTVALGLSTAVVTTGLAGASVFLAPISNLSFGLGGNGFPLFLGPIRGINITSTTVAGGVAVTEFT